MSVFLFNSKPIKVIPLDKKVLLCEIASLSKEHPLTKPVSPEVVFPMPVLDKDLQLLKPSVQKGMGTINLLSMPLRAMEKGVVAACGVNETTQKICQLSAEGIQSIINMVPQDARVALKSVITEINQDLPQRYYSRWGIPEKETAYFLESAGYVIKDALTRGVVKTTTAACRKVPVLLGKEPKVRFIESDLAVSGNSYAELFYKFIKRNQSLYVYVQYLEARGDYAGATFRALKELKSLAKEHHAKDLYIQWVPGNKRILDIALKATKKSEYLGKQRNILRRRTILQIIRPSTLMKMPVFRIEMEARNRYHLFLHMAAPTIVPATGTALQNFAPSPEQPNYQSRCLWGDDSADPFHNFSLSEREHTANKVSEKIHSAAPEEEPEETTPHFEVKDSRQLFLEMAEEAQAIDHIDEELLKDFGTNILNFTGQITGITPALDELKRVNEIVQCLAQNPQEAPLKIVSELFRQPVQNVRNILNNPKAIIQNAEHFLQNPAANYMGALAAVGSVMTWMDSVSWVCEFARKPGKEARNLVKMPYTVVKNAVQLGTSLIRHPERTSKQLFKSFIHMPGNTVKRFFRAVGLKKKKKKHHHQEAPPPTIDPIVLQQLVDKYVKELPALYCLARVKGFIDPYKTMEEYHHDLLDDWTSGALNFPNGFFDFPQFLVRIMQANSLVYLRTYSPRAHPDRPIISPEILLASAAINETFGKLDATFNELDEVHREHEEAAEQLSIEQEKLSKATEDLGSTLAQNREKIKQALIKKTKNRIKL
jgi:hypothetical protein